MTKKSPLIKLAMLLAFLCSSLMVRAQESATPVKTKTVVYTMQKQHEQSGLTAQLAIDIDKLLNSKKGILSSVTHAANRTVTVVVEGNFPPDVIKDLLRSTFKLEVESYQTTNNPN